jgi:ectoine hydroxylase-related dioxygenase (phytanoyl-CoA dioxygenase family)
MTRPLPTVEFEPTISDQMVEAYHRNGFTWVERITTDEEVEWLRSVFDELFLARRGGVEGGYFDLSRPYDADGDDNLPQVLVPELAVPDLANTLFRRNARTIAARLLGVDAATLDVWGHMISKPPRRGHVTPWHQDEAYWLPEKQYHATGAWMPLDDVDMENGCMCFIPGSHRLDVLPHRHIGDDPAVHGLETTVTVDVSEMVVVPLAAGGATFHHPRTLHYTPPNVSDRPRRAFASEYQTPSVLRDTPDHRQWFLDGQAAWDRRSPAGSS